MRKPMVENFIYYLGLVLVIIGAIMLANRLKVAYPIILVIAGLLISFIPGLPAIKIDPELIFIIFFLHFCMKLLLPFRGKKYGN
jgi:CPA1 family monovalent cation:H+ antiporter